MLSSATAYLKKQNKQRRKHRAFSLMAAVVVFITTYALILPAITLEPGCGLELHVHSEECYTMETVENDPVLACGMEETEGHAHGGDCYCDVTEMICGLEENEEHSHGDDCYVVTQELSCIEEEVEGHSHDDSCYAPPEEEFTQVQVLTCQLTEHEHSDACYVLEEEPAAENEAAEEAPEESPEDAADVPDETADVESAADWESSFAHVELAGDYPADLLAIASTQLGYAESGQNFITDDEGEQRGYTRYGQWYGEPYAPWSGLFLAFCLEYAEVPEDVFPRYADCQELLDELKEMEIFFEPGQWEPFPGDVMLLDKDGDGEADHAGIVHSIAQDGSVTILEGDSETNDVCLTELVPTNEMILGYSLAMEMEEAGTFDDVPTAVPLNTIEAYKSFSIEGVNAYPHDLFDGETVNCILELKAPVNTFNNNGPIVYAYFDMGENLLIDQVTCNHSNVEVSFDSETNRVYFTFTGEKSDNQYQSYTATAYISCTIHSDVIGKSEIIFSGRNLRIHKLQTNTVKDAFITDSRFARYYNANSPLGAAGSFHLVAFEYARLGTHTNGNVLAKTVDANSNFGTNNLSNELSYIQNYQNVNGGSGSMASHILVVGSKTELSMTDNGNSYAINGTKLDRPTPPNLIMDEDTETAPFIDLIRVEDEINRISGALAKFTENTVEFYGADMNNTYLLITDPNTFAFYNVKAVDGGIFSLNNIKIQGFESGCDGTVVINVDCTGADTIKMPNAPIVVDGQEQGTNEVTEFSNGKVVWNFINAEGVVINTGRMTGMIVAPGAKVHLTQNVNGTIVAEEIHVEAESHRTDFTGTLPRLEGVDDTCSITVKKEWADAEGSIAPELGSISVALWQISGGEHTVYDEYTITAADGWQKTITGLPAENCSYYLVETVPEGYTAQYENNDQEAGIMGGTITIRNVKVPEEVPDTSVALPETGGTGTHMFTLAGALMMLSALIMIRKKRGKSYEEY